MKLDRYICDDQECCNEFYVSGEQDVICCPCCGSDLFSFSDEYDTSTKEKELAKQIDSIIEQMNQLNAECENWKRQFFQTSSAWAIKKLEYEKALNNKKENQSCTKLLKQA